MKLLAVNKGFQMKNIFITKRMKEYNPKSK